MFFSATGFFLWWNTLLQCQWGPLSVSPSSCRFSLVYHLGKLLQVCRRRRRHLLESYFWLSFGGVNRFSFASNCIARSVVNRRSLNLGKIVCHVRECFNDLSNSSKSKNWKIIVTLICGTDRRVCLFSCQANESFSLKSNILEQWRDDTQVLEKVVLKSETF